MTAPFPLRGDQAEYEKSAHYWNGRLGATVGYAAKEMPKGHQREVVKETLAEFIASPVPSEELRAMLRTYLK